jgi:RNA polymerase sigma-70 factor (ECF subfamily)
MADASLPTTRASLLLRLQQGPPDQLGWDEFVERYGRHIYRWCRQWHLQDADAEDVSQIILLKLLQKLRAFSYDPSRSFRSWLKTVAHHAWQDFERGRSQGRSAPGDDQIRDPLRSVAARDDLVERLAEAFDLELLEAAKLRVRLRVAPHTWEAFRMGVIENEPVAEVATKLQMPVAMVYVAKSKVQKMLQQEIRNLEKGM